MACVAEGPVGSCLCLSPSSAPVTLVFFLLLQYCWFVLASAPIHLLSHKILRSDVRHHSDVSTRPPLQTASSDPSHWSTTCSPPAPLLFIGRRRGYCELGCRPLYKVSTAIKQVTQFFFFLFPSAYKSYVYTVLVKNLPANEGNVRDLGWEDPREEEMATHSSILA